jgi:Ca-activated chloride channel family protein
MADTGGPRRTQKKEKAMKRFHRLWTITFILAAWSCAPAVRRNAEEPDGSPAPETQAQMANANEASRFTPDSHPPVDRRNRSGRQDLSVLPALQLRHDACFGTARFEERKANIATGGAYGGGPGTMRSRRAAPSKGKRSAAPAASAESSAKDGMDAEAQIASDQDTPDGYEDWGAAIYLSNDDTMSLSSAQRVLYAIDHFLPLPAAHIRPHELLNYFSFDTAPVAPGSDFSVLAEIAPDPKQDGIHSLALSVAGRPVDKTSRRNAALTFVIDRSGSMSSEGRMSYLKQGLRRMLDELKTGDLVHLVIFDHQICTPVENFVVGRDDRRSLERAIDALSPRGSTDLHRGLTRGYEIADRAYQDNYSNRVIMITDALANTGVTNREMISTVSKYYDTRRIRLSGVGVGRHFNDALLDRLTERGKGAYLFLGSEAEVDAVFGSHFISLIETTANDVHFRLHLPPSLRMNVFYGEESSTVKADVQAIHYFANTTQLFLSDLQARDGVLRKDDGIMLSVEYEDPETGKQLKEEYAYRLGDIVGKAKNVGKARITMAFIDMLAQMAGRPLPATYRGVVGAWNDPESYGACENGTAELNRLAKTVSDDPEVKRVLELWGKYCSRYERPRRPVRRQVPPQPSAWPGARAE